MPANKPAKQIDIADFLNQQHLCESLTPNEVKTLMEFTEPVFVKKNDVIADIGEVGEAVFYYKGRSYPVFRGSRRGCRNRPPQGGRSHGRNVIF